MTEEEQPTRDELISRIESLERRVEQLEQQADGNHSENVTDGTDHRDVAVLEAVAKRGDPGPRGTLQLYLRETDIANRKTAKRRAKHLRQTTAFNEAVGE